MLLTSRLECVIFVVEKTPRGSVVEAGWSAQANVLTGGDSFYADWPVCYIGYSCQH